jgi:hypothetical protein
MVKSFSIGFVAGRGLFGCSWLGYTTAATI